MEKVADLKEPPVIGKLYLVECVMVDGEWIPIVGPFHDDKEILITRKHYHHDPRFMKLTYPSGHRDFTGEEAQLAQACFEDKNGFDPPRLMKRKCRRQMPIFPNHSNPGAIQIVAILDKLYEGRKVKCGKCPHRNMPLDSLVPDKDGNVICNGHGLKINMREGKVVKRNER